MSANLLSADAPQGRGRPRTFDPEGALAIGQALFHAHGYEGVGLAALTQALGIKPPSFYAAFGSKAAFFGRVLERYAAATLPLDEILQPGRPPIEALATLLDQAARTYAADPARPGCLVLEAVRGTGDAESLALARQTAGRKRAAIRAFIGRTHPETADTATDMVVTTMSGLSAGAREGWNVERLVAVARVTTAGLGTLLG
ncbi:MAG: TetR/AcrR family transcriptional regulator [Azospirillaceae bacterium]|nr:TetR/AcrR family transcriptional regulator [Azospirillaceae bacterium]